MIKTWKGKSTDFLLAICYFIIYCCIVHIIVSIRQSVKYNKDIVEAIWDPGGIAFTFFLLIFCMSPAWVYFRKVPKMMVLDSESGRLEIHKRKRTFRYNIDKIRYSKRVTNFFYVLEIHATFESSRKEEFEKLALTIVVPKWGLSWDMKKMEEIVKEFENQNIKEIKDRPLIPISEYFYR